MNLRRSRSAFDLRVDVLNAVSQLGDSAIASKIASLTNTSQKALRPHLAFLQVKDFITVADHTVEDRDRLKRRSISNIFRLTPKGSILLSRVIPLRDELTSDKISSRPVREPPRKENDLGSLVSI